MSEPSHRTWNGLSRRAQGVLAINAAAVIFGTAALYGKLNVSPFWIVALRGGFAASALALIGVYKGDLKSLPSASAMTILLSGLLLAAHWLTFFVSVQKAGVAVATLTFATFPLFTVLVEAAHQRRWPRPAEVAVGVVIVAAVALLVEPRGGQDKLGGAFAGLASGFTYALFWRTSHRLSSWSPVNLSFWQNSAVLAVLAPTLLIADPAPRTVIEWVSLAALGIINTAVMLLIYLYALKRISPSACSGFIALEPVYAILFAALFFHEHVTSWIMLSVVLILGASFTLLKIEKENPTSIL